MEIVPYKHDTAEKNHALLTLFFTHDRDGSPTGCTHGTDPIRMPHLREKSSVDATGFHDEPAAGFIRECL